MLTQGVKSPTLLLILLVILVAIDVIVVFNLRDKVRNWKARLPLFANLIIPIGSYLAFSDQQDEMYIWASKIDNFVDSGILGVELFDGNFGESSVSVLVFIVSSAIKTMFFMPTEVSLYVTGVLAAVLLISLSQIYFIKRNVIYAYAHLPAGFLITSFGFISSVSMSFDVSFTLLYCQLLFFIFMNKRKMFTYSSALIFGIAEWIRIEISVFKILFLILIALQVAKSSIRFVYAVKLVFLLLTPTIVLICYKLWAFNTITPAMVHFKSIQLDPTIFLRSLLYYFVSLGPVFFILLIWTLLVIFRKFRRLKTEPLICLSKIASAYDDYWFPVGIFILLFAPIYAGPDYYGPIYQRYLLTPLYLTLCYLVAIVDKRPLKSEITTSNLQESSVRPHEKVSVLMIVAILSVSANSFIFGWVISQGAALDGRPSRATCDQLLGPLVKNFWKDKSDKTLVIATSEANGIAYASTARLLDMSGVVDSRNYPTDYKPMTPGNMYAKFAFKESIFRERPSIIWPAYSESCNFFDPLLIHQEEMKSQLDKIYDFNFTKHWFPTQTDLLANGYCPSQVRLKQNGDIVAQASFYYLCLKPK